MRAFIIFLLSSVSVFAADTNLLFSSTVTTNQTGGVLTTETFTRGGQTNLVRITKSEQGVVVFRLQKFCHKGEPVAVFTFENGIQSFATAPKTPYQASLEFLPSKDVRCVMIFGGGFIDGFYPTNGVYYPAPDSDLEMKDYKK
jgi:hypothetical protein